MQPVGPHVQVHLPAGALLLGRYRATSLIARGGMGEVWRGTDTRLGGTVAIKFLTRSNENARRRFQDEAQIAARLPGVHGVRVFDQGEFDDVPFLVMEFLEGETLREKIRAEGALGQACTLKIVEQLVEGLSQAHALGVIHRDIKPENIFLARSGTNFIVKILDFGVAKWKNTQQTTTGDVVGTPVYSSPEQLVDSSRLGPTTDIWSLGVVTFECLTGERPFQGESLAQMLKAISQGQPSAPAFSDRLSPKLRFWFRHVLSADPLERPEHVFEFLKGLQVALGDKGSANDEVTTTVDRTARSPDSTAALEKPVSSKRSQNLGGKVLWIGLVSILTVGTVGWGARDSTSAQNEGTKDGSQVRSRIHSANPTEQETNPTEHDEDAPPKPAAALADPSVELEETKPLPEETTPSPEETKPLPEERTEKEKRVAPASLRADPLALPGAGSPKSARPASSTRLPPPTASALENESKPPPPAAPLGHTKVAVEPSSEEDLMWSSRR